MDKNYLTENFINKKICKRIKLIFTHVFSLETFSLSQEEEKGMYFKYMK